MCGPGQRDTEAVIVIVIVIGNRAAGNVAPRDPGAALPVARDHDRDRKAGPQARRLLGPGVPPCLQPGFRSQSRSRSRSRPQCPSAQGRTWESRLGAELRWHTGAQRVARTGPPCLQYAN
ncbi:hypothetical protein MDA_GLEAN10019625 [Myotis davidii]|uniref:Uncharacterized protein n=1 Tax=Myotis davidii TaxID=225400 RepID=L5LV95_MYODS|nr:hypothetical protein MDA_GLEAN10019625 [Myotis davidii]